MKIPNLQKKALTRRDWIKLHGDVKEEIGNLKTITADTNESNQTEERV